MYKLWHSWSTLLRRFPVKTVFIIILIALGSIADLSSSIKRAEAIDIYTSLIYDDKINISFEDSYSNGKAFAGNIQVSFNILLNQSYVGSDDIFGSTIAQGTFSGTFKWGGPSPPSGCVSEYQITATFTTIITGETYFQVNKVVLSGGYVSNIVQTISPTPSSRCMGWGNGLGIESLLGSCLSTIASGYYATSDCSEFPILGGSNNITKGGGNTAPTSVSGSTQLILVDSKKKVIEVEKCPEFTIIPTMPPESDPRGFATPDQDSASFRFNIFWGGENPVQANFQTNSEGGDTISSKFSFNPATLTTELTNVILETTTKTTPEGTYSIDVTATIMMPNSNLTCTTNTEVFLVVSRSISDFRLVAHTGQVQVTREDPTPAGGAAVLVRTGDNGSATIEIKATDISTPSNSTVTTTIDVGKNSETRYYNNVVNIADEIDDEFIQEDIRNSALYRDKGPIIRVVEAAWESVNEILLMSVEQQLGSDLVSKALKTFRCTFASSGTNNHEQCSGIDIFITNGQLHFYRTNEPMTNKKLWDILLHDYHIVIPLGTDLMMNSQHYGNSSLTVINGSAVVINLISGQAQVVNAGQQLDMTISISGNSIITEDQIIDMDMDSIPQWWDAYLNFPVTSGTKQYMINVKTNSTVKNVVLSNENKTISFTVSGANGTKGYVNTTWTKSLLNGTTINVTMDGTQIPFLLKQSDTNYSLYVNYTHSHHKIVITIPTTTILKTTTNSTTTTTKLTNTTSISTTTQELSNSDSQKTEYIIPFLFVVILIIFVIISVKASSNKKKDDRF